MTRSEVSTKLRNLGVSEVYLKRKRLVTLSSLYWLMTAGSDECLHQIGTYVSESSWGMGRM